MNVSLRDTAAAAFRNLFQQQQLINVEGVRAVGPLHAQSERDMQGATVSDIAVDDGRLTIDASGGNTKINTSQLLLSKESGLERSSGLPRSSRRRRQDPADRRLFLLNGMASINRIVLTGGLTRCLNNRDLSAADHQMIQAVVSPCVTAHFRPWRLSSGRTG